MDMNKNLFFSLAILCLILLVACEKANVEQNLEVDYGETRMQCENFKGTWLEEAKECESITEKDCVTLGGKFNECASACRNNPKAQVCTMQCVIVCQFGN